MSKNKKRQMPKPSLYKTIFQFRYKPQLKFFQLMVSAAQEFKEYPDWQFENPSSVVLKDFEKRCSLAIRHNHFTYDQDSGEREDQKECIEKVLEELPKALEITSYLRLGFRRHYLIDTAMSFSELVTVLNLKLISQENQLKKLMPPKVDDLIYRVDSSDGDIKFHITVGPVKKEEIPMHIPFTQDHHLDPQTRERDYQKIIEAYPDVAVFVDIDIYKATDSIPTDEARSFFRDSRDRTTDIVNSLRDYLFA